MPEYPRSWRINAKAGLRVPAPAEARDWYSIRNATATTAEVIVYDDIGEWGITAKDFIADLNKVTAKNIDIRLNSGGGSVFEGLAIFEALRRHPANVTTYADGVAASIASVIFMAGERRVIARNATVMIHDATGLCAGHAMDMDEMADLLDRVSNNLADVYAHRSGRGTVQSWRKAMLAETWYSAQEAVEAGLATERADADGEETWAQLTAGIQGAEGATEWARLTAHLRSEGVRIPRSAIQISPRNRNS